MKNLELLLATSLLDSFERILNQFPCRTLYNFSTNDIDDLRKIPLFDQAIEAGYDFNDFCDFLVVTVLTIYDQAELEDLKDTETYSLLTDYFDDFLEDPIDFIDYLVYRIVESYHLVPDRISTILNVAANTCLKSKDITFNDAVEKICKDEEAGYLAYEHLDEELFLAIIDEISILKEIIIDNDKEISEKVAAVLLELEL